MPNMVVSITNRRVLPHQMGDRWSTADSGRAETSRTWREGKAIGSGGRGDGCGKCDWTGFEILLLQQSAGFVATPKPTVEDDERKQGPDGDSPSVEDTPGD